MKKHLFKGGFSAKKSFCKNEKSSIHWRDLLLETRNQTRFQRTAAALLPISSFYTSSLLIVHVCLGCRLAYRAAGRVCKIFQSTWLLRRRALGLHWHWNSSARFLFLPAGAQTPSARWQQTYQHRQTTPVGASCTQKEQKLHELKLMTPDWIKKMEKNMPTNILRSGILSVLSGV